MDGPENIDSSSKKRPLHKMPQDFINQFSSKADMITYLKEQQQFYLPPATMITHDWVKLVFTGKKQWFKAADVVHANPPK